MNQIVTFVSCLKRAVHEVIAGTVPDLGFVPGELAIRKEREIPLTSGVFIIVGMTGQMRGRMIYRFDSRSALSLGGSLTGTHDTVLTDLALSGLTELTNMISGRTLSMPEFTELSIDITPPTLFSGRSITLQSLKIDVIQLPFTFRGGRLEVFIAIEEFAA